MALTRAQQIAHLRQRRDAVLAEIAALSANTAGGKPDATGPGVHVQHQAYKRGLYEELKLLDEQLKRVDSGFVESLER